MAARLCVHYHLVPLQTDLQFRSRRQLKGIQDFLEYGDLPAFGDDDCDHDGSSLHSTIWTPLTQAFHALLRLRGEVAVDVDDDIGGGGDEDADGAVVAGWHDGGVGEDLAGERIQR